MVPVAIISDVGAVMAMSAPIVVPPLDTDSPVFTPKPRYELG